jgi:hypothetical protein
MIKLWQFYSTGAIARPGPGPERKRKRSKILSRVLHTKYEGRVVSTANDWRCVFVVGI